MDYLFHMESACPVHVDNGRMLKGPIIISAQKYMNQKILGKAQYGLVYHRL